MLPFWQSCVGEQKNILWGASICNHRLTLNSASLNGLGKCLRVGSNIVERGSFKVMNSGGNSLFWFDCWCKTKPLRSLVFGPLHEHESVSKVKHVCVGPRIWNWNSNSFVFPENICNLIRATSVNPLSLKNDSLVWKSSVNGEFDLSSAYSLALSQNVLPVASCLIKRNIEVNPLCSLCGHQNGTLQHLFMDCSISRLIWEACPYPFNMKLHPEFVYRLKLNASSKDITTIYIPHGTIFIYCL